MRHAVRTAAAPGMNPYPAELSFNGVYYPPWLLAALAGLLLAWLLTRLANLFGLSRWVWHPPLFFTALVLLCTLGLGSTMIPAFFA
jgi:hypothetical protein